jgi:glycosyltransferase involved in cell wall biosynthesis
VYVISHSADLEKHAARVGSVQVLRIPGFDGRLPIYTESVRWLTHSAEVAAAVAELHARAPLDVVDFPEWGGEGYIHLLNRTEWNHIPTVIQLHGPMVMLAHTIGWPEVDSEFYRVGTAMEGTCVRLADAVFSSSRCSADWCARHYGIERARIPILHTGIDTRLFHLLDVPKESRPTIIFVGKVVENKGVDVLLETACRLVDAHPDLQVRMLGRGDPGTMARLQDKARACGHPDLLDLAGFIGREALPAHLSRAHIFAAPSFYEGGPGFVYLEAMACGLPVIACEGSGAAEVVIPGENGFLVPSGDPDALKEALRLLLSDPAKCQSMGARAREYVVAEADSERCLERLEAFYLSVLAGGKPPV